MSEEHLRVDLPDTSRTIAQLEAELTAPGTPFEMEEVAIRGVLTRVWKHAPATLADILVMSRGYADAVYMVYENDRSTFEELFRASVAVANALRDRFGVGKGDRVAIAMRNYPEWAVGFFGASAAGAVVVPLNSWWSGDELEYALADSGAKVVLVDDQRAALVAAHRAGLPGLETVIAARPSDEPAGDTLAWGDVFGPGTADATLPDVEVDTDDDATIFYTSGTTGHPKGALGTHRNVCSVPYCFLYLAVRSAARSRQLVGSAVEEVPPGGQRSHLLSVPLFHVTGCEAIMVGNLLAGGKLVMMHHWDAGRALELIERERVTLFGGVPTMVMQVLDHPDFDRYDTSSVKSISYGGAPAPPELVRRITAAFGPVPASNGYGLTETSSVSTMNSGVDYVRKPDSVGLPVPVAEVKVVDPDGAPLPAGQVGELWIKGPHVVKGYWNRPDATASTFSDGWLHTGDVARLDEEGFVTVVDRAKDMLIRGGENIYCVEIEDVLYEHPAVAEAAVIGIPHPTLGEEVGAVVHLRDGQSATEAELQRFVGERLAAFDVPARVWLYGRELPRNPAGKVIKRELRDELS